MSVLDTLEICFSANLGGVDAQLNALAGQLKDLSGVAAGSESALSSAGRCAGRAKEGRGLRCHSRRLSL